ncbi:hypothetical protein O59_001089 [Cellvibrio sp. BR]|nr:hypothetical protein O59_001089 [Cellvibrio sp. BR]
MSFSSTSLLLWFIRCGEAGVNSYMVKMTITQENEKTTAPVEVP